MFFQKHQDYLFELLVTKSYPEDFLACCEQNTVCQFTFDTLKYFLNILNWPFKNNSGIQLYVFTSIPT